MKKQKIKIKIKMSSKHEPPQKYIQEENYPKASLGSDILSGNNFIYNIISSNGNSETNKKSKNSNQKNLYLKNNITIFNKNNKNIKKVAKSKKESINLKYKNLNDEELNTLEYKIALTTDKRTYCQYYWSLLKKKQMILFAFIPQEDYNLKIIKIALILYLFLYTLL